MHVHPRNSGDTYFVALGNFSKKLFAWSVSTLFVFFLTDEFFPSALDTYFSVSVNAVVIFTSFLGLLSFYRHPTKKERFSRSDWAFILLLVAIILCISGLKILDMGVITTIGITILFLLGVGLGLYVWKGRDRGVNFILFDHDRRVKLTNYLRLNGMQWLGSGLLWLTILVVAGISLSYFFPNNKDSGYTINKQKAKELLITPTPTKIVTPEISPVPTEIVSTPNPTNEPTPLAEPTITPTPTPVIVNTDNFPAEYQVFVLNGSGVAGAASDIKALLESHDISVHYVGDAPPYNYLQTEIRYNEGYQTVAEAIYSVMRSSYDPLIIEQFEPGDRFNQYNVVVVHGQQ